MSEPREEREDPKLIATGSTLADISIWNMDKLAESALVRSWGGRALAIPFLHERSTTGLVAKIRTG